MNRFKNKIVLITGAGGGIGKAVARSVAAEEGRVILSDIKLDALQQTAKEIQAEYGCRPDCVQMNIADRSDVARAIGQVRTIHGKIDCLAHCSGVLSNGPFEDVPEKDIHFVIDVNLKGTMFVMQEVGAQMLAQGGGKMAIVASKAGKIGTPTLAHYAASKFGVIGLVQTAAMEWGRRGVYVNCVCPGEVDTPMLRRSYEKICQIENISMEEQMRRGGDMSLVGRLTPPENIAKAIKFLLLPESDEIMGQAINTDGGIVFH